MQEPRQFHFFLLIYSCEYYADLEVTQMLSQAFLQTMDHGLIARRTNFNILLVL